MPAIIVVVFIVLVGASPLWSRTNPPAPKETSASAAAAGLPVSIRATLDEEYPGWQLAPSGAEVRSEFKKLKSRHFPSLAIGDFDHDGKRDYAVQIVLSSPGQEEQIIMIFLARASGYEESILQSMGIDPGSFLWALKMKLDESGAQVEGGGSRDVLLVRGGPAGETTYAYDAGRFREMTLPEDSQTIDPTTPNPTLAAPQAEP